MMFRFLIISAVFLATAHATSEGHQGDKKTTTEREAAKCGRTLEAKKKRVRDYLAHKPKTVHGMQKHIEVLTLETTPDTDCQTTIRQQAQELGDNLVDEIDQKVTKMTQQIKDMKCKALWDKTFEQTKELNMYKDFFRSVRTQLDNADLTDPDPHATKYVDAFEAAMSNEREISKDQIEALNDELERNNRYVSYGTLMQWKARHERVTEELAATNAKMAKLLKNGAKDPQAQYAGLSC